MNTQPEALRLADALIERHGIESFEGDAAAELRRLHRHELALATWLEKTEWVQQTARPGELGMHRADVMRRRLERAEAQRDALLEALRRLLSYANVLEMRLIDADGEHGAMRQARAAIAIAKTEGENA